MSDHSIYVQWSGEGQHLTGHNPIGPTVAIDSDKEQGTSPMVLLLHAEAGCTALDVLSLLEKMRQPITGLKIEIDAVKGDGEFPRVWEKIHVRYIISGAVEEEKALKAVNLSLEKYCSVSAMLGKTAHITHEVVLLPSA
jgi:putative redox protein